MRLKQKAAGVVSPKLLLRFASVLLCIRCVSPIFNRYCDRLRVSMVLADPAWANV